MRYDRRRFRRVAFFAPAAGLARAMAGAQLGRILVLALFAAALAWSQPITPAVKPQCSATVTTNCTPLVNGSGVYVPAAGGTPLKRILLTGQAANCQAGVVAASGWSTGASGGPVPACEADGFSGYLPFAVGAANYAYAMVPLPADWAGTLNIDVRAWSTGTTAQTLAVDHYCVHVNAATVTGGTFTSTANVSMTMRASSYLSTGTAALDTTGCAAGDEYRVRISMTASTTAFNLVRAMITE